MADLPDGFYVHQATITPHAGAGASGPRYGTPFPIKCFITHKRRLVRNSQGDEVVSEATVRCPLSYAAQIPPESLIALHTERATPTVRDAEIITIAENSDGGLGAWQHLRLDV